MGTLQQQNDGGSTLREAGPIGNLVRNLRGWLRAPAEPDRAFMDHKFSEYLAVVDEHGTCSPAAQAFRDGLEPLPRAIRSEILRLCDLLDKRRSSKLLGSE